MEEILVFSTPQSQSRVNVLSWSGDLAVCSGLGEALVKMRQQNRERRNGE